MEKYDNKKRESNPIIIGGVLFFLLCIIILVCMMKKDNPRSNVADDTVHNNFTEDEEYLKPEKKDIVVVIDPGHGGNDPGKVSGDGVLEKDLNLQISVKLKEELSRRGIQGIMTRKEDKNLATEGATNKKNSDMNNRVEFINESSPILLVSIHQNSYSDSSVRGPQVFYYGESKASETFAKVLQENLKKLNPKYSREAKEGNDYYILSKSVCPGVIVECGFLSCPEETALLVSDEYQQKIASAIADAIEDTY